MEVHQQAAFAPIYLRKRQTRPKWQRPIRAAWRRRADGTRDNEEAVSDEPEP